MSEVLYMFYQLKPNVKIEQGRFLVLEILEGRIGKVKARKQGTIMITF